MVVCIIVYIQSGMVCVLCVVNKSFIIMGFKCCVPGCTSNYNSAGKEGKCSTFGFPQDPIFRQKWLHHIPRAFVNIAKNTGLCIKHIEEKYVHTYSIHPNPDGYTYKVSKIIYY